MGKSVNKNTIYNTIRSIFGVIFPLITFPYISRVLLTENLGKINFGNSIVSYVSMVASLGVSTYAIRECSKVKDDREKLSHTASQIISINIVSTLIAYVGLGIVLIAAKPLENYRLLICIQSTTVLFTTLGAEWLNTVLEDFKFVTIRTIVMQILSFALMLIFVRRPEDYMIYAGLCVLASSGTSIINIFYRRRFCTTRFTLKMDIRKHLPGILMLFSLILSQTIYVNSDMTILGLIKGDHETGLYSSSVKIYNIVNGTLASVTWVVMPKLSYFFARKDYPEINKLLKYALNYILVLGIPSICGLEIIAPHLITAIAGEAYVDAALSLRILGFALFCSFLAGWVGNMTWLPAGKEKTCLKVSLVSAGINIVLNLILIPIWGLNAAALTTGISECFAMVCGFIMIDKKIKIDGMQKMIIGPLIGGMGILAIGWIVQKTIGDALIVSIVTIGISVIWYFVVMLITRNEFFMGFFNSFLRKIRKA